MSINPDKSGQILLEAVDDLLQASDMEDLWARLTERLKVFGITGAVYGAEAMPDPTRELGRILNSIDNDWLGDKLDQDLFYCDEYVEAARTETAPILWSDASRLPHVSEAALRSLALDYEHGVITGVTIPMRFAGGLGASSIGCHARDMSFAEFDRIWAENTAVITGIINAFDVRLRGDFRFELFSLGDRERECLTRMANGQQAQRIAHDMGLTDRQYERLVKSARDGLCATTSAQAVATALIFELITP